MSDILTALKKNGFNKPSQNKKNTDVPTLPPITEDEEDDIELENTTGLAKKYLKLPIGDLVKIRGGVQGLKEYSIILKNLTSIAESEQKQAERRNELVEKDFIISNVKKYLDLFMSNLFDLTESQKAIITAIYKTDPEKAEFKVAELRNKAYTKISKETKRAINQSLKGLNKKYDKTED